MHFANEVEPDNEPMSLFHLHVAELQSQSALLTEQQIDAKQIPPNLGQMAELAHYLANYPDSSFIS